MVSIDILYFAWVREAIGLDEERIDHPGPTTTIADIVDRLMAKGGGYAQAFADRSKLRAALDQRFVALDTPIGEAKELALFPPVTGGQASILVRVGEADFDPAKEIAELEASGGGGIATFMGLVRGEGGLVSLHLDHYPAMTEVQLNRIAREAAERWPLLAVRLIHRSGTLVPGDRIVFVGTASRHRAAALESCAFLIDWLKTDAPFWKRENFAGGESRWVEAKADDAARAERWQV